MIDTCYSVYFEPNAYTSFTHQYDFLGCKHKKYPGLDPNDPIRQFFKVTHQGKKIFSDHCAPKKLLDFLKEYGLPFERLAKLEHVESGLPFEGKPEKVKKEPDPNKKVSKVQVRNAIWKEFKARKDDQAFWDMVIDTSWGRDVNEQRDYFLGTRASKEDCSIVRTKKDAEKNILKIIHVYSLKYKAVVKINPAGTEILGVTFEDIEIPTWF